MMSHTTCEHPSTPAARAKCRRANGVSTPRTEGATPRVLRLRDDREEHPADPARCCTVCKLRKIEWKGTDYITGILLYLCDKCKYHATLSGDLQEVEV